MSDQRFIIKMGMGVAGSVAEAADRAIADAEGHSSLHLLDKLDGARGQLRLQVTLGVPDPASLDADSIAARFVPAPTTVTVTEGGLTTTDPETGQTTYVAAAGVEAFLPLQQS